MAPEPPPLQLVILADQVIAPVLGSFRFGLRYAVRTKPLARRTLRVSVKSGLPILVGRDHHLLSLSPFF
jgi:hypothetical protein